MPGEYRTARLNWRGIGIEVRYDPAWSKGVAHLEIKSVVPPKAPLPVTETGYRSHFHPAGRIEDQYGGDVIAAVRDWLDMRAQDLSWIAYIEASRQGDLFADL